MQIEDTHSLFKDIFEITVILDNRGLIKFASDNTREALGYDIKQLLNTSFYEYLSESSSVKLRLSLEQDKEYLLTKPFKVEVRDKAKDIKSFYAKVITLPEANTLGSYIINLYDISIKKRIETIQNRNANFYQAIFENFPDGFIGVIDEALNIIFLGGELIDTFNIDYKNIMDKNISELFKSKEELIIQKCKEAFSGKKQEFEYINRRAKHFLSIHIMPMARQSEKDTPQVLFTAQDISERKTSEEKLRHTNLELQNKNAALNQQKVALEDINEELIAQRKNTEMILGKLNDTNRLLSLQNQELLTQEEELSTANEELRVQQEQLQINKENLEAKNGVLEKTISKIEKLNTELVKSNQNLSLKEEELAEINEALIAHQKNLTETMNELSDRNFELDQIVYRTSHDIRAPLTSILGLVNLMRLEDMPEELLEYVDRIESSILKLDRFVNSMLNFAKANRSDSVKEAVDFDDIIDKALEDVKYLENFSKVSVTKDIHSNNLSFQSDILRVSIIFANLISNAIKYANPKLSDSFLKIRIDLSNKEAKIKFEDNGIGIDEQYIDKVFDMFFRANDTQQGSGLGLYIVKQTIEKMSGSIKIQSKLDEGSTFDIIIPC